MSQKKHFLCDGFDGLEQHPLTTLTVYAKTVKLSSFTLLSIYIRFCLCPVNTSFHRCLINSLVVMPLTLRPRGSRSYAPANKESIAVFPLQAPSPRAFSTLHFCFHSLLHALLAWSLVRLFPLTLAVRAPLDAFCPWPSGRCVCPGHEGVTLSQACSSRVVWLLFAPR